MGKNEGKVDSVENMALRLKAPVVAAKFDYTPYTLEELTLARYIYGSRRARGAHKSVEVKFPDGTSQIIKTPLRWPLSPAVWIQKPRRERDIEAAAISSQIELIIWEALQE